MRPGASLGYDGDFDATRRTGDASASILLNGQLMSPVTDGVASVGHDNSAFPVSLFAATTTHPLTRSESHVASTHSHNSVNDGSASGACERLKAEDGIFPNSGKWTIDTNQWRW